MLFFKFLYRKLDDDDESKDCQFKRAVTSGSSYIRGASLRASTRGELSSYMLRRSVKSRASTTSITSNTPSVINTRL